MSKKIIITEEQFKQFINEELGIAKKVIEITDSIEKIIYKFLDSDNNKESINIYDDLNISLNKLYYNNIYEFYDAYNLNPGIYINGYSFSEKTIYFTFIIINKQIYNFENISNTIQHEVTHYWQCKMKGSGLSTKHYQTIIELMNSNNEYVSTIATVLYYSKKFEMDAQINGAFNELKKHPNIFDIKKIIEITELGNLENTLKELKNKIISWPYESINVYNALNTINLNHKLRNKNAKPYNRKRLIDIINETLDYFYRKVGRIYSLYVEKNKFNNLKKVREDLSNNRLTITL